MRSDPTDWHLKKGFIGREAPGRALCASHTILEKIVVSESITRIQADSPLCMRPACAEEADVSWDGDCTMFATACVFVICFRKEENKTAVQH